MGLDADDNSNSVPTNEPKPEPVYTSANQRPALRPDSLKEDQSWRQSGIDPQKDYFCTAPKAMGMSEELSKDMVIVH